MSVTGVGARERNMKAGPGEKIQIIAWADGARTKEEKRLGYSVLGGKPGKVDANGVFTAPVLKTMDTIEVAVFSQMEKSKSVTVRIEVRAIQPLSILPDNQTVISGGRLELRAKYEVSINLAWSITAPSADKGKINPETGLFEAPAVIKNRQDVEVVAVDRLDPANQAKAKIVLEPVEIIAGAQGRLHAAGGKTILPFESKNDPIGKKNFNCRILAGPGRVTTDGIYEAPFRVDGPTGVTVVASSNLDPKKNAKMTFVVGFPLCGCGAETDRFGVCGACGGAISYGAHLAKTKKKKKP